MTGLASTGVVVPALHPDAGQADGPVLTKTAAQTRADVDRAGRAVGETVGDLPRGSDPTHRKTWGRSPGACHVSHEWKE
jgi:hypothetical protein